MATAYLTFALVLLKYILDPDQGNESGPIDRVVYNSTARRLSEKTRVQLRRWKDPVEKIIRTYSDQQSVTSLAILAAGFSRLFPDDAGQAMTSYHWHTMIYTAWFASLTHLATLTSLRGYFRNTSLGVRMVRLALMLCTIILLVAALVPTVRHNWLIYPALHACCFYGPEQFPGGRAWDIRLERIGNPEATFTISLIVLVFGYVSRAIQLFPLISTTCRGWIFKTPAAWAKAGIVAIDAWPVIGSVLSAYSLMWLFTSMLWEVRTRHLTVPLIVPLSFGLSKQGVYLFATLGHLALLWAFVGNGTIARDKICSLQSTA